MRSPSMSSPASPSPILSEAPEPHRGRASRLLRAHPEIKKLFGRNPWTALIALGLVSVQLGAAWCLRDAPWWLIVAASWGGGALVGTALYAIQHELAHHLVFESKPLNRLLGFVANTPWMIPASTSYAHFHLVHHSHQGVRGVDPDLPSALELKLASFGPLGKLLCVALFPFAQVWRTARHPRQPNTAWLVANVVFIVLVDVLLVLTVGGGGVAFLLLSFYFSMGPHPIAGRFIQEHHVIGEAQDGAAQETNSYYGCLDPLLMHVGHHNEHHDFPFVAWNRLPRVRAAAPELYDALPAVRSWGALLARFVSSEHLGPHRRIVREQRGRARARAVDEALPSARPAIGLRPRPRKAGI